MICFAFCMLGVVFTEALTSFLDVFVHVITSCWGVWDVIVRHKVNLETWLEQTAADSESSSLTARQHRTLQEDQCIPRSLQWSIDTQTVVSVAVNCCDCGYSRDVWSGTLASASTERFALFRPRSGSVWRRRSARPRSSPWSPCICWSGYRCTLWTNGHKQRNQWALATVPVKNQVIKLIGNVKIAAQSVRKGMQRKDTRSLCSMFTLTVTNDCHYFDLAVEFGDTCSYLQQ